MKTFFSFIIFCFLLLFVHLSHARKEPGEYWRSVMKDEPMPEAIKGLIHEDPKGSAMDSGKKMKQLVRDFDSRHSLIIYHNSPESKQQDKTYAKKSDIKN
ncbi:Cytochrome c oxidase bioproteinsis protein Cmc1-like isoform 1 [Hibiscus syriacus]|uniref:Cytochrome c oxidase bioproteinsis protein Cmc1-like isoform 1 n=1 Tax=Hibiscus syriacus TaxID=106335 RepID=A0A6A3AQU7_HIBSY|nr:organ-specific protein P4-like [Hibiscus syriacus]KAE8706626.1 Cytochrome c oxidase bioproteinsis protein Cmc1-like isoform 1 [Hibiscus syriacus]